MIIGDAVYTQIVHLREEKIKKMKKGEQNTNKITNIHVCFVTFREMFVKGKSYHDIWRAFNFHNFFFHSFICMVAVYRLLNSQICEFNLEFFLLAFSMRFLT